MKQGTHQEEAEFKYLWMDAQTRGNWAKQAQVATSRLEGVGNTTGSVQTLPSARSRATAYGARSRAGRSTQRASAGPSGGCQRSRRRRQSRAAATPAATGAEQGGGELAAIQRGATGRRQAVSLCGRIAQGRGVWGAEGEGEITTVPFHTSN